MQELAYRIGMLLSSYSQAINKQNKTTGSLFQQKTKAKILLDESNGAKISYLVQCFCYIHQNPIKAGLTTRLADWPYSSYEHYTDLSRETICNREIFFKHTGFMPKEIAEICPTGIQEKSLERLF